MRKLLLFFCTGVLFFQEAVAEPGCTLKPGNDIHCASCVTLEQFAFYGASALYPSRNHLQRSIQVIGNNGSSVFVTKRVAWNQANLSVRLGRLGEFGVDLPYPNLNEAQVTAYDINHKLKGVLPNGGRFEYGALNAKCKQIEKDREEAEKKKEKEDERALDDLTWAAEAAAMNPATTIAMNQRYGYGFGNRWYGSPGACWGTSTGVMCQPY